jgi:nicotinamidase-related amidase
MSLQRPRMTRDNTAVLLIDYQVGLLTGVGDVSVRVLRRNTIALVKSAQTLHLPILATTTARDRWGPTISELNDFLGPGQTIDRPSVNPWDFPPFVAAVQAIGRSHLVLAGLGFEIGVPLLAISARRQGYHPVVAVDACGTSTTGNRRSGIERLTGLRVELSDPALLFSEIAAADAGSSKRPDK